MGLFGFNPEKRIAKGDEELAKGFYYDARMIYEDILRREGIPDAVRARAKEGWRKARAALIEAQIDEAKRQLAAGDEEEAAQSCRSAIEQADEDLDASEARAMLEKISGGSPEAQRAALLKHLVESGAAEAVPPREVDGAEPEEIVTGGSDEEVFEVYMNAFPEEIADRYRAFGPEFRFAYVKLQEGKTDEALELLDSTPEGIRDDPLLRLERGQALLLADRNDEALQAIEGIALPKEIDARRSHMRVILLERLDRREEAEADVKRLWTADPVNPDVTVLYGEILIAAGKHQEALDLLRPFKREGRPQPELDNLIAQAYRGAGMVAEAQLLLERTVERYFQGGYASGDMQRFPIWAARQLLDIYVSTGQDPERTEALRNHLVKQDPGNAERYLGAADQSPE